MKQRLSKLQKWILSKCLQDIQLRRNTVREYFNKRVSSKYLNAALSAWEETRVDEEITEQRTGMFRRWNWEQKIWENVEETHKYVKNEFISTKAVEVTITRSLTNLVRKGLLIRLSKYGDYALTEQGFVKANNIARSCNNVNNTVTGFSDVNNCPSGVTFANFKAYQEIIDKTTTEQKARELVRQNSFKPPSEEKQSKILELKSKLKDYESKFTPSTINALCCSACQEKIAKLQLDSGAKELEALKNEITSMS